MAFDDYFKQLFKKEYGDAIKSEISVGALEKSFDLWIQGTHPLIQSSEMIPALFKHHKDNIIEYKSSHDTYHNSDILKVIGDCFYFSYNRKKHLDYISCDTCVWFIVVNPEGLKLHYQK